MIANADAIVDPLTVMVIALYTRVACVAMT